MKSLKNFLFTPLGVLCLLLGLSWSVLAQPGATTGDLNGTIFDEQSGAISGATISITNVNTGITRDITANEEGFYSLSNLQPGTYKVKVTADGFTSVMATITLDLGVKTKADLVLKPANVDTEIIEVSASTSVYEGKTETSLNQDQGRIVNLPINRRNFLDFALTTPGVTRDRLPPFGSTATSGISFNGQTARGNNITIDGLSNNDSSTNGVRTTFGQDAVGEYQVIADGYNAEFGRAVGGVVNIVTRRGSNDLHGTSFFFVRGNETSARDVFIANEPNYEQYQFGISLSGPIKKDKTFFFTSFERLSIKQNIIVTIPDALVKSINKQNFPVGNGAVPFSIGNTAFLGRVDHQLSTNNSLAARFNINYRYDGAFETFGETLGGLASDTSSGQQRLSPDLTFAVSDTYVNSRLNLVNEVRFLYGRKDQDVIANDSQNPLVQIIAPIGRIAFGRNNLLPQSRTDNIFQIVDNVSLSRGRNQIKFGFDFVRDNFLDNTSVPIFKGGVYAFVPIDFRANRGPVLGALEAFDPDLRTPEQRSFLLFLSAFFPGTIPGFPNLPLDRIPVPAAYFQGFGDTRQATNLTFFSTYAQDEVRLKPNLLLKFGIRYDLNRLGFIPDNNGVVAPRIALSYRPGNLSKIAIHASYGIFAGIPPSIAQLAQPFQSGKYKVVVQQFPLSVIPYQLPGRKFPEGNTLPAGFPFTPQMSREFAVAPKFDNLYSHQANFGIDYQFDSNNILSVSYRYIRGLKIVSGRNINPITRPELGILGRPIPNRGELFVFDSSFDSYYNGLSLLFVRRATKHLNLYASYTFSKAIDNVPDIRTDLARPFDPLDPGNERSLSIQDVRNRFAGSFTWDLNYTTNPILRNFLVSSIVTLESGRPYNLFAGLDLNRNGDNPFFGDRPPTSGLLSSFTPNCGCVIGRNAGITPGFANVDMRLSRNFVVGKERFRIQAFVEVFNLFNRVNISQINNSFSVDPQGRFNLPVKEDGRFTVSKDRFINAFSPRQAQLGLRIDF